MDKSYGKIRKSKRPAVVRVKNNYRAQEIFETCVQNGWQVIIGIEPDKKEDISDVERLHNPPEPVRAHFKRGRNDPCYCGSNKKYKACCIDS